MPTPHFTVTVLGIGCRSCRNTYALVEEVARAGGVPIALTRADDPRQFIAYGVMRPPAVVIDGRLVHAGGMPSRSAVEGWLRAKATP
jgi:predicted thioredoxin/glutaredoxin